LSSYNYGREKSPALTLSVSKGLPHSAFRNPQSAFQRGVPSQIENRKSQIPNGLHSAIRIPQSAIERSNHLVQCAVSKSKIQNPKSADRLARKCATALNKAIDALPDLLDKAEPEAAAAIVADLIKSYLARPIPEPDPGAALADVIRLAHQEELASASEQ
jgi:hypothetical protein